MRNAFNPFLGNAETNVETFLESCRLLVYGHIPYCTNTLGNSMLKITTIGFDFSLLFPIITIFIAHDL